MMNLFAYGTLMDAEIMIRVSGVAREGVKAVLQNYIRRTVRGEVFPGIAARQGSRVDGILYPDLPPQALKRLDRFEGDLYVRTPVTVVSEGGRWIAAQAYAVADRFVERLSDEEWSFRRFLENDKEAFWAGYPGYGRT